MVGMDHMAVCYGRRRGSWGGKSEVRSYVYWFCQKCGTGNWWSRADCRHYASVTNGEADTPQTSAPEKIAVLEKTLAGMGDDEPILDGKRVLEKELVKLQRKLNSPTKTAKHIEAKQKWINRTGSTENPNPSSPRVQVGGAAREPQSAKRNIESGLRGDQDSPIDGQKKKSHIMSPENTEVRILEQQELALRRRSASKRRAGWTRDGSAEEIAGWMSEAQRPNREVEAKKRKLQETIERESGKDARMGYDAMDGLDGSLSS